MIICIMNKELIKNVIADQRELIEEKLKNEKIIGRDGIEKCSRYLKYPNVLLISGIRRSGKSIFAHLLAGHKKYASINFDDERLMDFSTGDFNLVMESFYELYENFDYLLFDEIQNIKGWELFINRLREKFKIIVTGSNANLLSKDLATHLTGRFNDFVLYPMNFKEYLSFKEKAPNLNYFSTKQRALASGLFKDYLYNGGIFEYYKFGKEFIRNLFSSIITKDVVVRYKIRRAKELEDLAVLMANYFASKISMSNLANVLRVKSPNTIREHVGYLENSFLFFTINKFSFKIKEQLSTFKKVYCTDNGILSSLIFNISENRGRFLENMVAIELKRNSYLYDYEIYYWDNGSKFECDFIVKKQARVVSAIQVCSELTIKNKKREIGGLVEAMKYFGLKEGYIFTLSEEDELIEDGFKINIVPVWKWILTGESGHQATLKTA